MATTDCLVWEVWSVSPWGLRLTCRKVYSYDEWQFAEKMGELLREYGHDDVEIRLSSRERD